MRSSAMARAVITSLTCGFRRRAGQADQAVTPTGAAFRW